MGMEQGDYITDGGGGGGDYAAPDYGGADLGVDYASYYAPVADQAAPADTGQYAYDPSTGGVVDTGLQQTDLFGAFFDYYSAQGYDDSTAMQLAAADAAGGAIVSETTSAPAPPPNLPDVGQFFPLPYVSPYSPYETPPYIPTFPGGEPPPPPPGLPPSPATGQPGLPPYCPAGQYHPYPIGDPRQNICAPFPQATTQGAKPPAGAPAPAPAPKPPTQAKPPTLPPCPPGYYRAPNGACLPIPRCTTPGTVYDTNSGQCRPVAQVSAPVACAAPMVFDSTQGACVMPAQAAPAGDIFSGLKSIPLWVWLAAAGLLLLNQGSGDRTTTVRYRRAT